MSVTASGRLRKRYRPCLWPLCNSGSSDRYAIDLCQEHILYVWSVVDDDMRSSNTQPNLDEPIARQLREDAARREPLPNPGSIYYIQVGDYLKIGHTKHLPSRLRQYPPNTVLLAYHAGTRDDEQEIHRRFAAYRDAGREWYIDAQEIRDHIATLTDRPPQIVAKTRRTKAIQPAASSRRAWTHAL